MQKKLSLLAGVVMLASTANVSADTFEKRVSVGVIAGTTGFGGDISYRFHENLAVTARYTDGLDVDTDFEEDGVDYDADFGMKASSLKLDYFPLGGRFFISAGAMMPDIEASVTGTPQDGMTYELNGTNYSASQIGSVVGTATVADSTQPYLGWGWRSSNERGLGFFSEFGVVATDIDVSLHTTNGFENLDPTLRDDLRGEEESLKDDIDKLPVFPVALIGISYTF
ncbi:hypothetical protein LPL18_005145 [Halomonas sp. CUBES01]|uniref:Outer membrane protein n=1 Tax=Vreelandella gomseomensis TaxID=370766 RepID=A0ABU1GGG0_9GAMM|nr:MULTISPECIES: hypothetical protein [Halomonas]MDR5876561.1 hypothetical protein [Halomonas gomseomensis]MEC4766722.1 hypothetical protein [Halomonas sp. CUBES01]